MDMNLFCLPSELDGHKLSLRWKPTFIKLKYWSELVHIQPAYSVGSCQITLWRRTPETQFYITWLSFLLKLFLKAPAFLWKFSTFLLPSSYPFVSGHVTLKIYPEKLGRTLSPGVTLQSQVNIIGVQLVWGKGSPIFKEYHSMFQFTCKTLA